MGAHRHNYERSTPVYKGTVMAPGTAPVYVVNGIGGSREGNTGGLDGSGPSWRVVGYDRKPNATVGNDGLFGYAIVTVTEDVLSYQQYIDDSSHPLDQFTISPRPASGVGNIHVQ